MKTYTLYTCAGQLQLHQGRKGVQVPVVILNRREQVMGPTEQILWSRLCWRFRDREQLRRDFETAAEQLTLLDEEKGAAFDGLLCRLMARGLVMAGEGDSQVDALYDLLCNFYVAPHRQQLFRPADVLRPACVGASGARGVGEKAPEERSPHRAGTAYPGPYPAGHAVYCGVGQM